MKAEKDAAELITSSQPVFSYYSIAQVKRDIHRVLRVHTHLLPGSQASHTQIHTKSANFEDICIYFSILEALNEFRTLTLYCQQMKAGRKSKSAYIYMHRKSLLT